MKIQLKTFHLRLIERFKVMFNYSILCVKSLMYNHHLSQSYIADVLMEPIMKLLDDKKVFKKFLGPMFVVAVIALTSAYVFICYWIGLPWYLERSIGMTIFLMIVGNWLLINVVFHYFMAVTTHPGTPPIDQTYNAVSICKKCTIPKPPRTHHCSVCNKCITKFDHHCPFINQCVGHRNHRYFFLYMAYTVIGVLFVTIFGAKLGYEVIFLSDGGGWEETEELLGNPVKFNKTGHIIQMSEIDYADAGLVPMTHDLPIGENSDPNEYKCIIFMAIISLAVLIALGSLTVWHYRLISRGETSVEYYVNKAEHKRLNEFGKQFNNPYDFGYKTNWTIFLGLIRGRSVIKNVLLPSTHEPIGDGLQWIKFYEINNVKSEFRN